MSRPGNSLAFVWIGVVLPLIAHALDKETANLIQTLMTKDEYTHREKIQDPEAICNSTEVIRHRVIHRCGKYFFYSSKQLKGCWGASGAGAWEASNPLIHFTNGEESFRVGYGDRQPIFLPEQKGQTCRDVLISSEGDRFGRIYHQTGYGKFSFNPATKTYEPEKNGSTFVEYSSSGERKSKKSPAIQKRNPPKR